MGLALVLALAVAHGALYALWLPPWAITDEEQHFDYAERLAHGEGPPVFGQSFLSESVARAAYDSERWAKFGFTQPPGPDPRSWGLEGYSYEAHQPPLYYALSAAAFHALPDDPTERVFAARVLMLLLSLGTLACLGLTVLTLWPERSDLALLACVVLISMPGRTGATTILNNDGLAELLGAIVVLLTTRVAVRGVGLAGALSLGALLGLSLLTKMNCAVLALPIAAAFWLRRFDARIWRRIGVAALAFAVMIVPWLVWSARTQSPLTEASQWADLRFWQPTPLEPRALAIAVIRVLQIFWFHTEFFLDWRYGSPPRSLVAACAFWALAGLLLVAVGGALQRMRSAWPGSARGAAASRLWPLVLFGTFASATLAVVGLEARGLVPGGQGRLLLPVVTAALGALVACATGRGGPWLLAAIALVSFSVDAFWLLDGQLIDYYWRSAYGSRLAAELGLTQLEPLGLFALAMSDKPRWIPPFAALAAGATPLALLALGVRAACSGRARR